MRALAVLGLIAATLVCSRADRGSASAASATNGRIAFVRTGEDGRDIGEIHVVNADGTAPRNLTKNPADDEDPVWSPDGSRIAFVRNGPVHRHGVQWGINVYVMNADGTAPRRLTSTAWSDSPVWSPDGQRIAFFRHITYPPGNTVGNTISDVYVMNADGSGRRRLTRNRFAEYSLTWSRSGTLAFIRAPTLEPKADSGAEIEVMNPDGTGRGLLTRNHVPESALAWSPSGRQLAFARWSGEFRYSIFVMNADGTGERRLTPPALSSGNAVAYPVWSPDGTKIALRWGRKTDDWIYVMNADGSGRRRIARDPLGPAPTWSPDGHLIAYHRYPAIYVVTEDGSAERRIVPRPGRPAYALGENWSPVWSPAR